MIKRISAILRILFWASAAIAAVVLLVVNAMAALEIWEQRQPLGRLRAEHAEQLRQIQRYDELCDSMRELADELRKERTQVFSMLRSCRSRDDFVVKSGPWMVGYHMFHDSSQHEPAILFYLPEGKHRLQFISASVSSRPGMRQFMFERDLSRFEFESIELEGNQVYEIRFFKITPNAPSPAGFQLLGPGTDGTDAVIVTRPLPFSRPVAGVGGGYGDSRIFRLPHWEPPSTSAVPDGRTKAMTLIGQQAFRLANGKDQGTDSPGPRGGVRFFLETTGEANPPTSVALDALIGFMRQPATPKDNTEDFFRRGAAAPELLRSELADRPSNTAP